MKTSKVNFLIDALAFAFFVFLTSTGVILYYILPAGIGRSSTIWQLDRHEWGSIHFYMALGFLSILSLHLVFHWKWIVCMLKGKPRSQTGNKVAMGLIGLLALIAIAAAPLLSSVETSGERGAKMRHDSEKADSTMRIEGSMTLQEIQQITGVPAYYILQGLKLPPTIPTNRKLGQLKNTYHFTMEEVRKVLSEYKPKE